MNIFVWLVVLAVSFAQQVQAESVRRLNIQSHFDQFELLLTPNGATVGGKSADLGSFKDLLPLLTNPLTAECTPPKGPADVTVKEAGQTRSIYIQLGIVTDGKNCLNVAGDGLMYFPVHRDFLIGPKQEHISIHSPIKIFRQGVKIIELKKSGATWTSEGTSLLLNWDFLERLQNSLQTYDVRFRALPELAKGKMKMIIQLGEQSFEFYKVNNVTWAVKKPGGHWLTASDDWSFWYNMDNAVIEDRFTPQIEFLSALGKNPGERLAAMDKLEGSYSRNLIDLYHHMVLNAQEDEAIQRMAFKRLRAKPTLATALVMAQYLEHGENPEFKKMASQILKINNPKGPLYNPSASENERAKVVDFWRQWAAKNQSNP